MASGNRGVPSPYKRADGGTLFPNNHVRFPERTNRLGLGPHAARRRRRRRRWRRRRKKEEEEEEEEEEEGEGEEEGEAEGQESLYNWLTPDHLPLAATTGNPMALFM